MGSPDGQPDQQQQANQAQAEVVAGQLSLLRQLDSLAMQLANVPPISKPMGQIHQIVMNSMRDLVSMSAPAEVAAPPTLG